MGERHCLRIPFLVGQREDTIIGNSCADNPAWEVPCNDADLTGAVCVSADLPENVPDVLTLAEDLSVTATLSEPSEILVTL